jgi:isopentenyl diphosphate isomerase/L-lactate dehydrogenase-like FMN-dependent dehydrogenase
VHVGRSLALPGTGSRRINEVKLMGESIEDRFQNLHEFVTQARINLDRNNWDYLIGGLESKTTLARNRLALDSSETCRSPLILKGVATAEDAKLALEHGFDCICVSSSIPVWA